MKPYRKKLEFAGRVLWLIKCLEEDRTTPERFIREIRKLALELRNSKEG